MDADLLLLDQNPLADILNTRSIQSVMQGDRLYDRTDLDNMLKKVRSMKNEDVKFLAPIF